MNLMHDPWIATTSGPLSIVSALNQAADTQLLGCAEDQIVVLRLLLAVCYVGHESSGSLLKHGVSQATLTNLQQYRARFELLTGYWTCADLPGKTDSLSRLVATAATNHNPVFHAHTWDGDPLELDAAVLVYHLLRYQLFGMVAGQSSLGYRFRSPAATAAIPVAVGQNLLETLALNLVPDDATPMATWQRPSLCAEDFRTQSRATPTSVAERYTWVAQGVRFVNDGVVTTRGLQLSATGDPMTARQPLAGERSTYVRLIGESAYLTACAVTGGRGEPAPTLAHAQTRTNYSWSLSRAAREPPSSFTKQFLVVLIPRH
jgi:hypothetical protein